jgi:hypothetical protein
VWIGTSGHSGGTGLVKDYEKLCFAAAIGWRVFLLADSMITDEYLGSIATAIFCGMQQPLLFQELPNNSILGNSPTAKELRQKRGYEGTSDIFDPKRLRDASTITGFITIEVSE